jgi:hypothetical protein
MPTGCYTLGYTAPKALYSVAPFHIAYGLAKVAMKSKHTSMYIYGCSRQVDKIVTKIEQLSSPWWANSIH